MDTFITNVTAVTMTPGAEVLFGVNIGITDGKIEFISKKVPEEMPKTIIEGTGMVAMPGLINCHTHLATSVLRCFTDDLTNKEALEALLQKEAKMDSRSAKAAALLSIAECLRFGVTSVSDLYYYPNATAQAVAESGIKANLALSSYRYIDQNEEFDFETDEQCRELQKVVDKWHGYDNGRIKIDAGIFAEYTSNYPLWESLAGYASEKGLGMQLHLSETRNEVDSCLDRTGMTPGELLACHRLFAVPATASGCAFLESEEAKMLGKKKVSAVALPLSAANIFSCRQENNVTVKQYPMFWTWLDYRPGMNFDSVCQVMNDIGMDGIMLNAPTPDDYRIAIPIARKHGIEVYAWLWTMNLEHDRDKILAEHPDWFSVNRNGKSLADTTAYVDYYKFLCPALPEVREFIREKIKSYCEVEGLNGIAIDYNRLVDVVLPTTFSAGYPR